MRVEIKQQYLWWFVFTPYIYLYTLNHDQMARDVFTHAAFLAINPKMAYKIL